MIKKRELYLLIFCMLSSISSCSYLFNKIANMKEMPQEAKSYMLFLSDCTPFLDTANFELVPNKNGLKYPFSKIGTSFSGRALFKNKTTQQTVSFMTGISITSNKSQAERLFDTDKKLGVFYKKSITNVNPNDFNVEKTFCIEDSTRFYLLLQNENILTSFDIDNISGFYVSEASIRPIILAKWRNTPKDLPK